MTYKICRFPFQNPADVARSGRGPSVVIAGISEALREDPRFQPMREPHGPDDLLWFPAGGRRLREAVQAGRPLAIGPQTLYASAWHPGAGYEPTLMAHKQLVAVFCSSRWYADLHWRAMPQHRDKIFVLDTPICAAWLEIPHAAPLVRDALIFVKGKEAEAAIGDELAEMHPSHVLLRYGKFRREELLEAARSSRVCYYVARSDHYPVAGMEIGLMGCPIIADERSCPVPAHRLTGIRAVVRERDGMPDWAPDAARVLHAEFEAAIGLDRELVRALTIVKHSPETMRARVGAALGLPASGEQETAA